MSDSKNIHLGLEHIFTSRAVTRTYQYPDISPIYLKPGANEKLYIDSFQNSQLNNITSTAQVYGPVVPKTDDLYQIYFASQDNLGTSVCISKTLDYHYAFAGAPYEFAAANYGGGISVHGENNVFSSSKVTPTGVDFNTQSGAASTINESGNLLGFSYGNNLTVEFFKRVGVDWESFQISTGVGEFISMGQDTMVAVLNTNRVDVWNYSASAWALVDTLQFSDSGSEISNRRLAIDNDDTIAYISNEYLKVFIFEDNAWTQVMNLPVPSMYMLYLFNNNLIVGNFDEVWTFERSALGPFVKTQVIPKITSNIDNICCNDYSVYLGYGTSLQQYVKGSDLAWELYGSPYSPSGYTLACNNQWVISGRASANGGLGEFYMIASNYYVNENITISNINLDASESLITINTPNLIIDGTLNSKSPKTKYIKTCNSTGTTQNVPHNTDTALSTIFTNPNISGTGDFGTIFDTSGVFQIIIPEDGVYNISARFSFETLVSNSLELTILINGIPGYINSANFNPSTTGYNMGQAYTLYDLSAGDRISLSAYQNSGFTTVLNLAEMKLYFFGF